MLNNGEERKSLFLKNDNGWKCTWIEGIGSTFGPTFSEFCRVDFGEALLCFSVEDELLYPVSQDACFQEITSVQNFLPSDVKIYPNPFNQNLQIEFTETIVESYKIFDLLGQRILEGNVVNGLIDVSSVPVGTFVILLEAADGNVYSDKLVKLD